MAQLCSKILNELEHSGCALSITFVGARKIRQLNRQYRRMDSATDVLSFGYAGELEDGLPLLGDIVLCPEMAARNAFRWNTTPERELGRLLIHGILHLLGFDHETDSGEMKQLQKRLFRRHFFANTAPVLCSRADR